MTLFRKKPIVIEAFQNPPNDDQTRRMPPKWFFIALHNGEVSLESDGTVRIKTLEGTMTADIGDWIIQGVKGEIYPCKPDIFAATYEEVR